MSDWGKYYITFNARSSSAMYENVEAPDATTAVAAARRQWDKDHNARRWSTGTVTRTDGKTDVDGNRTWTLPCGRKD